MLMCLLFQTCSHSNADGSQLVCQAPYLSGTSSVTRRRRQAGEIHIGFLMDNVTNLLRLEDFVFEVMEDPHYNKFPEGKQKFKGDNLVLQVRNMDVVFYFFFISVSSMLNHVSYVSSVFQGRNLNLACTAGEVDVLIGVEYCKVGSLSATTLVCSPPEKQPAHLDLGTGLTDKTQLPEVIVS